MPRSRPPYAPEFRRQMVELVRTGRSPEELAREFEPAASFAMHATGEYVVRSSTPALPDSRLPCRYGRLRTLAYSRREKCEPAIEPVYARLYTRLAG